MKTNQSGKLFWGGPAHGEYMRVDGWVCEMAEFTTLNYILDPPDMLSPAFKTITYQANEFTWMWKEKIKSGIIMVSGQPSWINPNIQEVENVMAFLGSLWL